MAIGNVDGNDDSIPTPLTLLLLLSETGTEETGYTVATLH